MGTAQLVDIQYQLAKHHNGTPLKIAYKLQHRTTSLIKRDKTKHYPLGVALGSYF